MTVDFRLQIHKSGDTVKLFTEDKRRDISANLPMIVEELKSLPVQKLILDCEMVWWISGKPIPRHEMMAIIAGKKPLTGEDIRANVFDCLFFNGESLIKKPWTTRQEYLKKALPKDTKHIKRVTPRIASNEKELKEAIKKASKYTGSEGAMLKQTNSTYPLTGRTTKWCKFKKVLEISLKVIGVRQKRISGKPVNTFFYRGAFLSDGKLQPMESQHILSPADMEEEAEWKMGEGFEKRKPGEYGYGETYGTSVKAKIGDIITVAPVHILEFKGKDNANHFSWMFPRFRNIEPDVKTPANIAGMRLLIKPELQTNEFEFSLTPNGVHIPAAIDNASTLDTESKPAMLHQTGLYLTPPHGKLIVQGKKKAVIKSFQLKTHIDEPLYLLSGKLCYGIIKLKKGQKISVKELQKSFEKHQVSETERRLWWEDYKELFFYPVEVIRTFDPPKPYKYQRGPQVFVKDVKFTEEGDEPTRQEVKEAQKIKGNWFLVEQPKGKDFRYVVQTHQRGESVHLDLRIEANDHLTGWTLDTPSLAAEGLKGPQAKYAETKYNRFLHPRDPSRTKDYQILVQQKLKMPKEWLKVEGKIPAGGIGATVKLPAEFKIISSGIARWGTSKTDFNEIFLKPDKKWAQEQIAGRWVIIYIPRPTKYERAGEGKMMWAMFKPDEQRPYVETHNLKEEIEKAKKENIEMLWQHPDGSVSKKFT